MQDKGSTNSGACDAGNSFANGPNGLGWLEGWQAPPQSRTTIYSLAEGQTYG